MDEDESPHPTVDVQIVDYKIDDPNAYVLRLPPSLSHARTCTQMYLHLHLHVHTHSRHHFDDDARTLIRFLNDECFIVYDLATGAKWVYNEPPIRSAIYRTYGDQHPEIMTKVCDQVVS